MARPGSSRRWTNWPSTAKGTTVASSSSSTTSKATTACFYSSISIACMERSRIRSPWAPRSCGSPPIASPSRTLRIRWLPEFGPHSREKTAVHPSLPRTRGHRPRPSTPRQEPRPESHDETHAQLFLGQIRREFLQTHHPSRHHPLRISSISSPIPPSTFTR